MSKVKSARTPGVFASSGYKGVMRRGSKYAWEFISNTGHSLRKAGYDTAEEAAYAYDEAVIKVTGGHGITNQTLGFLKPRDIVKIREKLAKQEVHTPTTKHRGKSVGATGFKGVRQTKSKKNPFNAQITVNGKYVHLGSFPTAEVAARAYDQYALQHQGIDAETNVSLGLLPPLEEPVFNPNKTISQNSGNNVNKEEDVIKTHDSYEQERERQLQAARIMMEREEAEEKIKPQRSTPVNKPIKPSRVTQEISTGEVMPPLDSITFMPSEPVRRDAPFYPTPKTPAAASDLMASALSAMHAAWEAEHHQERGVILQMVDTMARSVAGYQQAVSQLIDHGADLEQQLQELKALLEK